MKKPKWYNVDGCHDTPFGQFIRARLRALDMSPGELARALDVTPGRVSQMFTSYSGTRMPSKTSLFRLARELKTDLETLLGVLVAKKI